MNLFLEKQLSVGSLRLRSLPAGPEQGKDLQCSTSGFIEKANTYEFYYLEVGVEAFLLYLRSTSERWRRRDTGTVQDMEPKAIRSVVH